MNDFNHIEKLSAIGSSYIGFEFEFFTDLLKGQMKNSLENFLEKSIVVTDVYHSQIEPTSKKFKVEHDYSGGSKMYELVTGPIKYNEAIPVLYKILRWISKNGYTTDRCAFQFSVSYEKFSPGIKTKMEEIDKLKFLLGIDEGIIYKNFGNRFNNVYTRSVKRIVPRNRFSILENIKSIDPKMFKVPSEKYFGVNFEKLPKGYLEIRYLGGKDYEKKPREIREVIDYICLYIYDHLSGRIGGYNGEDIKKVNQMMDQYKKVVRSFSDPDSFFMYYPDFHLLVDLKGWDENLKTYYPVIRDKIFDLIVDGNMRSGFLNYDTSVGRFQVKDAKIRDGFNIDGFDLINCSVGNTVIKNCNLYSCEVKNSEIFDSSLLGGNSIKNSKIKNTDSFYSDVLKGCYIDSKGKTISSEIIGGVLRNGNTNDETRISDSTERVKGWSEKESQKFITDSRLKNLNGKFKEFRFKNQN